MNATLITIFATLTASAAISQAAVVFTDDFDYTSSGKFITEGGWQKAIGAQMGTTGSGSSAYYWGESSYLEFNYTAQTIAGGDVITMDANVVGSGTNPYEMTIYTWDGSDYNNKTQVATSSPSSTSGALPQLSYTASASDDGKQIIFHYGHGDSSNSQTSDVTFSITAVPEPSSLALLGLGGVALLLRRKKQFIYLN